MFGISALVLTLSIGVTHQGSVHWVLWLVGVPISVVVIGASAKGLRSSRTLIAQAIAAKRVISPRQAAAMEPPSLRNQATRRQFIAHQAPKWGERATLMMAKRNQDGMLVAVSGCLLFIGRSTDPSKQWPMIVQIGLVVVCVLALVRAIHFWRMMNQAASDTLGIKIGWRRGHHPPRKAAAYEDWCRSVGLDPYSAVRGT